MEYDREAVLGINKKLQKRVIKGLLLIFLGLTVGVWGFIYVEKLSFLEALYMTVITISSVGYGKIRELTPEGEVFTIFIVTLNFFIVTYALSLISTFLFDGVFKNELKNYKLNKKISKLKDHVIVCGYGRVGKQVCHELKTSGTPFVVIEKEKLMVEKLKTKGVMVIEGNATQDDALIHAVIENASSIITTLPSDANNVFVVLTARSMNKKLKIISRADYESSIDKLKKAGANHVIMPQAIGGHHIAALITRPDVVEFFQLILDDKKTSISTEEFSFENLKEEYKNKSIKELNIKQQSGVNIIGLKNSNNEYIINPSTDFILQPDTILIVLGTMNQVLKMKEIYIKS